MMYEDRLREKIIEEIYHAIDSDRQMCIGADIQNYLLKVLEDNIDYNKGLNDAWELIRRFLWQEENSSENFEEILGYGCLEEILDKLTPQEALAKLKAYEEQSKIEVGDILLIYGEEAVVTRVVDEHANILFGDGVTNNMPVKELVGDKTGKHLDIQSILSQIGGE